MKHGLILLLLMLTGMATLEAQAAPRGRSDHASIVCWWPVKPVPARTAQ